MKSKIAVWTAARLDQELVSSNSRLMVAKNDSASALPQHCPVRPTDSLTPNWSARVANWWLVYWADSTGQYTSFEFTAHLLDAGIDASIGTVGDALDNALMPARAPTARGVLDEADSAQCGERRVGAQPLGIVAHGDLRGQTPTMRIPQPSANRDDHQPSAPTTARLQGQ
jgi:hypothetical protein